MENYRRYDRFGYSSPAVREAAVTNRRNMPPSEVRLWGALRAHRLNGLKFRRQHPIGRYVVDFCRLSAMLIIEVDGDSHTAQVQGDRMRDAFLRQHGFRIIGVRNDDVIRDFGGVLDRIAEAAASSIQG